MPQPPANKALSETTIGGLYALGAYLVWGVNPLFWKELVHIDPAEVLGHRLVWSMVLLAVLLAFQGRFGELRELLSSRRRLQVFLLSAALISCNWWTYLYAVTSEQVLQASLGYFMNPLFNVFLGMLFLGERPRPWQWVALALAAAGVAQLVIYTGGVPWIALGLMASFGFYGLVRKTAPADSMLGTSAEVCFLGPLALVYLGLLAARGEAAFPAADAYVWTFLVLSGVLTAVPLMWFAHAARRLPLTVVGMFQYLAPTLQFLLAVWVFHEPFSTLQLRAFVCIWVALTIFTVEAQLRRRRELRRLALASTASG